MDETTIVAELIDIDNIDLNDNGKYMVQPKIHKPISKEYVNEIELLLIKTNFINMIDNLLYIEDSDDKIRLYQNICILKNNIIIH